MSRVCPDSVLSWGGGGGGRKELGRDGVGVPGTHLQVSSPTTQTPPPPKSIIVKENDGILQRAGAEKQRPCPVF